MVRTTRHQAFQLPVCHSQRSGSSGKEANRWEEQFFLGMEEDAAIEYGTNPNATALFGELKVAIVKFGKPQVASRIGISRNSLTKSFDTKCQNLSPRLSQKIGSAIVVLNSEASEVKKLLDFARIEVTKTGLSEFARRLQVDASDLNKIVEGKRKLSRQLAVKFERYFRASQASYAKIQGRYN
jgi:hypothetical protein